MAVHIVQVLCPQRHCIFAFAYEPDGKEITDPAMIRKAEETLREMIAKKEINAHCGLCGSTTLRAEAGRTRFATMAEAMPHIKQEEAKQMLTRLLLGVK